MMVDANVNGDNNGTTGGASDDAMIQSASPASDFFLRGEVIRDISFDTYPRQTISHTGVVHHWKLEHVYDLQLGWWTWKGLIMEVAPILKFDGKPIYTNRLERGDPALLKKAFIDFGSPRFSLYDWRANHGLWPEQTGIIVWPRGVSRMICRNAGEYVYIMKKIG